jgi:deoxycytidylate deaminase
MNDHSPLLARDYKFFEAARRAAESSDFKVRVGAVAVWRRKVIASAASQNKTKPVQKYWNKFRSFSQNEECLPKLHAEIALISKLQKLDIDMRDVSVYVYRICKSREKGLARPCAACISAIRNAHISRIYYSTDIGYAAEVINGA